jgi:histidinol-phosphatase (PHP family)
MLFDCHLHSAISSDSKSSALEMCRAAVNMHASTICFTEHFDMNPADTNYLFYNHEKYCAEIERAKAAFGDRIEILQGIEFSEPHSYPRDFEMMTKKNFDFILGSLHWFNETWAGAADIQRKYSLQEISEMHFEETLKMVQSGGFDSLAHMDFPRRYIEGCTEPDDLIARILSTLIKSNISLELNSSPLRKGKDFTLPSRAILQKYKSLGGTSVTMGSDAHGPDEVCSGFGYLAEQAASLQLKPVIYRGRKPCACGGDS